MTEFVIDLLFVIFLLICAFVGVFFYIRHLLEKDVDLK